MRPFTFLALPALLAFASVAAAAIVPLGWEPSTGIRVRNYKIGTRSFPIASQNGGDYTAPIKIGPSDLRVVLDSGSSNLAVAGSSCACGGVKPYAMTGSNTGHSISVQYGSGSWSGTVFNDDVSFGGQSARVDFGVITYQETFFKTTVYSGILGLAFSSLAVNGIPPLLKSYGVDVFGMQLCRQNAGATSSAGNMAFGFDATSQNGFYSGSILYTPLTGNQGYYTVTSDSASVAGSRAVGSWQPIIDSGTNALVIPGGLYNSLVSQIQSATGTHLSTFSICPSSISSMPNMEVSFKDTAGNSFSLTITPNDYCPHMTDSGTTHRRFVVESNANDPILGTPLLNSNYVVFDKANRRVGFAPIANCGSSVQSNSNAVVGGSSQQRQGSQGLSSHAIAGIAAGSTLAVLGTVVAIIALLRKHRDQAHLQDKSVNI